MTQAIETPSNEPLNMRQLAFARELGVALAAGGRDAEILKAYEAAGYSSDRGNARRLAADPRVKAIALTECRAALERAGLHIEYLQAKALEMLHLSPVAIHRAILKCLDDDGTWRDDLTPAEIAELERATWALSKLKIGDLHIEIADKKALVEMLAKQLGVGKDDNSVNVSMSLENLVAASMAPAKEDAA